MTEDAELLDEIFPIYQTQLEMIRDNGYDLDSEEQKALSISDSTVFVNLYLQKFNQGVEEKKFGTIYDMFRKRYITTNKIDTFMYYIDPRIDKGKNVNKGAIANVIALVKTGVAEIVLITKTPLGTGSTDDLQKFTYRHFLFSELQYNAVKKSIFVPQYEILSEVEAIDFLRSNMIDNPETIPKLKFDDKAKKYYNMKLGQIVRIIAKVIYYDSMTSEKMSYRIVTD